MGDDEPSDEPEGPPPIETKCFQKFGQIYYGDCQRQPNGTYVRQGFGRQVLTGETVAWDPDGKGQRVTLGAYEGYWENQRMSGRGKYKWNDGSSYEGDFLNGQMEGVGIFRWPDGSSYNGAWHKGQMHGQGRFESRLDGDFLEGHFHRNCYQEFDGRWIDVLGEHRRMEREMLVDGDTRRILVIRCSTPEELSQAIRRVQEDENLVPFVISDQSVQESPLVWLQSSGRGSGGGEETTIQVSEVALAKRRQHDYKKMLFEKIQAALLTAQTFTVVFDDPQDISGVVDPGNPQEEQQPEPSAGGFGKSNDTTGKKKIFSNLPEEWRLSNLVDDHSFPSELFDLKLFHGRSKQDFFLPREMRGVWLKQPGGADSAAEEAAGADGEAPPADAAPPAEGEPSGEGGEGGAVKDTSAFVEPLLTDTPKVYLLRSCAVAQGKIESERGSDVIREEVVRQFGSHLPLHRCAILVLSQESYLPRADDLHATY